MKIGQAQITSQLRQVYLSQNASKQKAERSTEDFSIAPENPASESFSSSERFSSYLNAITPKEHLHSIKAVPKHDLSLATPEKVRETLSKLSFHTLNPFVASVAMAVDITNYPRPKRSFSMDLNMPEFYNKPLRVKVNLENGPDAPLVVIFNGVHAKENSNIGSSIAYHAQQKGYNFISVPNPTSSTSLKADPKVLPGNPQHEAKLGFNILKEFKKIFPKYSDQISLTGYSYGGLQAINVARYQEEQIRNGNLNERIVNRAITTVNPPRNLRSSMRQLDSLRHTYEGKPLRNKYWMSLHYKWVTLFKKYNKFPTSSLSKRVGDAAATEARVADIHGSRKGLRLLLKYCEGWNPESQSSKTVINDSINTDDLKEKDTYQYLLHEFADRDPWYKKHDTNPLRVMHRWSYSKALSSLKETPLHVVTLSSKDDYILSNTDVRSMKKIEQYYNKNNFSTRIFDHGGHVGLLFNPEIFGAISSTW